MLPLVCLDVDGTLVGSTGGPTAVVWAAADRAVQRGQHLALCTARWAAGPTWDYAQRLDPDGWHVFHAGAALVHSGAEAPICTPLERAVADRCAEIATRHGWVLEHYTLSDVAVDSDERLAFDHAALLGVEHRRRSPDDLPGDRMRVQFIIDEADTADVVAAVGAGPSVSIANSPVMPGATFVSVAAPGVTKATAILTLAGLLGVDIGEVMMVGDGHNDIEAMEAVGHGVAMANADPACAAVARHHVGHVDADGVADALALSVELGSAVER